MLFPTSRNMGCAVLWPLVLQKPSSPWLFAKWQSPPQHRSLASSFQSQCSGTASNFLVHCADWAHTRSEASNPTDFARSK